MYNLIDFHNKRIVVVGASSGIGRSTAVLLSRLGGNISIIARRENKLIETIKELDGNMNSFYVYDMNDIDNIPFLFDKIIQNDGKIDGLVYAAGKSIDMPLKVIKQDKIEDLFTTNFYAFAECIKNVCKKGRYNEGLRIVGISSVASLRGSKAQEVYAASKAAMDGFIRCVAIEQASKGISINNVAPSWVKTDMMDKYLNITELEELNGLDRQYKGILQAQDVANVIAFLLSSASKMITGVTIPVDGGYTSC